MIELRSEQARRGSLKIDDKPSYSALKGHIAYVHPRKNGSEKFGICNNLGRYPYPFPCIKTRVEQEITEMSKEIGIGPALFLLSSKTLIWFFILLTILNIPVYMFLYKSNQTADCSGSNPFGCFDKFTLGSIGQNDVACAHINFS